MPFTPVVFPWILVASFLRILYAVGKNAAGRDGGYGAGLQALLQGGGPGGAAAGGLQFRISKVCAGLRLGSRRPGPLSDPLCGLRPGDAGAGGQDFRPGAGGRLPHPPRRAGPLRRGGLRPLGVLLGGLCRGERRAVPGPDWLCRRERRVRPGRGGPLPALPVGDLQGPWERLPQRRAHGGLSSGRPGPADGGHAPQRGGGPGPLRPAWGGVHPPELLPRPHHRRGGPSGGREPELSLPGLPGRVRLLP